MSGWSDDPDIFVPFVNQTSALQVLRCPDKGAALAVRIIAFADACGVCVLPPGLEQSCPGVFRDVVARWGGLAGLVDGLAENIEGNLLCAFDLFSVEYGLIAVGSIA